MFPLIYAREEAGRCLLCNNPPCSKACQKSDTGRAIRSYYFQNPHNATHIALDADCSTCTTKLCVKACLRGQVDRPIDIPFLMEHFASQAKDHGLSESDSTKTGCVQEPSLAIDFCGFSCENPFVLGSSVITSSYDMCASALSMGWGGVAIKTLTLSTYKEISPRFEVSGKTGGHFSGFKNLEQLSERSIEEDLKWVARLKQNFPTKLIIVSIMGCDEAEWELLAHMVSQSGADIIECNFSCPQMTLKGLGSDTGQDAVLVRKYTAACRRASTKPILAKLTPNLSEPNEFVEAALAGGADGIAGINTVKSLVTINLQEVQGCLGRTAVSGYSGRAVKPIALRFMRDTAMILPADSHWLSGIGGIENWKDALDFILLGCTNVQVCTAVMEYGQRIIEDLTQGLIMYMKSCGLESLNQLVGQSLDKIVSPAELDRTTILYPQFDQSKCVRCGRCYLSCRDGGHQAITIEAGRRPQLVKQKCVGCHLCRLVCPVLAIGIGERVLKN